MQWLGCKTCETHGSIPLPFILDVATKNAQIATHPCYTTQSNALCNSLIFSGQSSGGSASLPQRPPENAVDAMLARATEVPSDPYIYMDVDNPVPNDYYLYMDKSVSSDPYMDMNKPVDPTRP